MQIRRTINGSIRLTRFKEYLAFVIVTSLLGATAASNGSFGWKLIGVLLANWLAVAFAFMINDVEDAEDDALTPHKCQRNPVSAHDLSPFTARLMSFGVAAGSALVYSTLGKTTFLLGMITLLISFLYSWKPVRLKNIAFVDFFVHGFMLSGLQFLTGYFTFDPAPFMHWIFPFLFVFCISCYGEMFNEMRDLDGDLKAGLKHTAAVLGPRVTARLMGAVMVLAVISGIITAFVIRLVAFWVLWLVLVLSLIFILPAVMRIRRNKNGIALQESFQKPLECAAAIALGSYFTWSWAVQHVLPWLAAFRLPT
ncbi:MAG TPA: UbiA family prenyltransferase [Bellilinea sp.]|jgi:4-hydroxybenzoate polyprenyltransferase|nr:UbiA family prenyltransferase [Bellilinea sp.]